MPDQIYAWKRFVCRRAGSPQLTDRGYLYDPDAQLGAAYNPDVTALASLQEAPCLIVLGEPGIGKTTALRDEWQRRQRELDATNTFLLVDLGSYQTAEAMKNGIFSSTTVQAWRAGGHRLHLFLDSLDECMLRIDTAPTLLRDELASCPVERLSLVIACRAVDWPLSLEEGLAAVWGTPIEPFELVPLRRSDVTLAASAEGLSPDKFLEEIDRLGAVPLAIHPIPLKFLIDTFKRYARFPDSSVDLYTQGFEILASEVNPARRERRLMGRLSARERLAIAGRIAALTVLANRSVIWTGLDLGEVPDNAIRVSEVEGGTEPLDVGSVEVAEPAIRETLATSLFLARDVNQASWAHRTYSEFLAVCWLREREFALAQIADILAQPADGSGRIIPQLAEVAVWLASMDHSWFAYVMKKDPVLLLGTDLSAMTDRDKAELVAAVLQPEPAEILARALDLRTGYWKLKYPTLADQLRPQVTDPRTDTEVRRVAIDIAAACKLTSLEQDLQSVALDPSAPVSVRIDAVQAIRDLGAPPSRVALKPLVLGPLTEDRDDELKGAVLFALWPDHISIKDVVDHLETPKSDLFGLYWLFLTNGFAPRIQTHDLPIALDWATRQPPLHTLPSAFSRLIGSIFLRAWKELDDVSVRKAFGEAARVRIGQHDDIAADNAAFRNEIASDEGRRRAALLAMVEDASEPHELVRQLLFGAGEFILSKDLGWLLDRAKSSQSDVLRDAWLELVDVVFYGGSQADIDAVWQACEEQHEFAQKLARSGLPAAMAACHAFVRAPAAGGGARELPRGDRSRSGSERGRGQRGSG